jgi:hypothetical protein
MKAVMIALGALAISTAFPASAQVTGSRLPGRSGAMVSSIGMPDDSEIGARPSDEAVRVMRGVTKCLVQSKRSAVAKYVESATDEDRKTNVARLSRFLSLCLDDAEPGAMEIQIGGATFRGALAEALLENQPFRPLPPIEPSKTEVPSWLSDAADQRVVEEMAICLADRYPEESEALVRSAPGSPAEAAAFSAFTPLIGPCLIRGTTLHANRVGIRLALADALYHRVAEEAKPAAMSPTESPKPAFVAPAAVPAPESPKPEFVAPAAAIAAAASGSLAATASADFGDRYIACVAQSEAVEAQALLSAATADAARKPYRVLSDDSRCFDRTFGNQQFSPEQADFPMGIMRGDLAELALRASGARAGALSPLALKQKRYIRPWFAATGRNEAVDEMAACVADTDPQGILALVGTARGSSSEGAAVAAMSASLTKCLSAGTRLEASRPALRAALADALYQRLSNPALSLADTQGARK